MPARLKSFALWLFVFAAGCALGWVVKERTAKSESHGAKTETLKTMFQETITVTRPGESAGDTIVYHLAPHTIREGEDGKVQHRIGERPAFEERSWVIHLHGADVRVFCREVNKR